VLFHQGLEIRLFILPVLHLKYQIAMCIHYKIIYINFLNGIITLPFCGCHVTSLMQLQVTIINWNWSTIPVRSWCAGLIAVYTDNMVEWINPLRIFRLEWFRRWQFDNTCNAACNTLNELVLFQSKFLLQWVIDTQCCRKIPRKITYKKKKLPEVVQYMHIGGLLVIWLL